MSEPWMEQENLGPIVRRWRLRETPIYLEALDMRYRGETDYYYLVVRGIPRAKATPPLVNNLTEAMEWAEKRAKRVAAERV